MAEELKPEDFRSAVWKKIEKYLQDRLDAHRKKNDGALSPENTNKLRGQIAEVKAFLDLARTQPEVPAEPNTD